MKSRWLQQWLLHGKDDLMSLHLVYAGPGARRGVGKSADPGRQPRPDPADRDQAVGRALSRVGEHGYSLTSWNCEHFARWCATGVAASQQVISAVAAFFELLRAAFIAATAVLAAAALAE
jgi:Lecithin retinol acyltransferase